MKKILTFFILVKCSLIYSQTFSWGIVAGSAGDEFNQSIATDAFGNVYSTGSFQGTADFDPGIGITNLVSAGGGEVYIQKIGYSGNLIWAKSLSGPGGYDVGRRIALDKYGNVYIAGTFEGLCDFDPGPGSFTIQSVSGMADVFILKLDSSGNFLWAKSLEGASTEDAFSLAIDQNGDLITTGDFNSTVDFDPGPMQYNINTSPGYDSFILKLDSAGQFKWVKILDGNVTAYAYATCLDSENNIYITGVFGYTVDLDPGTAIANFTSLYTSAFILKLDSIGSFVYAKVIGNASFIQGRSITTDNAKNIYITGQFYDTVDFDPGAGVYNIASNNSPNTSDAFILKLDSVGNFIWAQPIGGKDYDGGSSVKIDSIGDIYIAGTFQDTVDFDPGSAIFDAIALPTYTGAYLLKLDNNGNFKSVSTTGGITGHALYYSIALGNNNDIYVGGDYYSTVDLNPESGILSFTSNGNRDIFIQKFSQANLSGVISRTPEFNGLIYPNPTSGKLHLQLKDNIKEFKIELFSYDGKLIYENLAKNQNSATLNILTEPGVYFVRVTNETGTGVFKVIKE